VVEKVCEYMSFKAYYEGPGSKEGVDVNEFTERIPPEVALELYVTPLSLRIWSV
jgi:transcription elongation factor B subunit 1